MNEVSTIRLHALRAGYLLLVVGLGSQIWPAIFRHAGDWELMHGVVASMLGALSALALLGLRYPLKMLPLLLFEMAWKSIWLVSVALPLWLGDRLDPDSTETAIECLMAAVFPLLIPWPYLIRHYLLKAGDPWIWRVAKASPVIS